MSNKKSGIIGYVYTKTSITLKFQNGDAYRYDLSDHLNRIQLNEMIALAKKNSGLTRFLNSNPNIKKYGYLDNTLKSVSFNSY